MSARRRKWWGWGYADEGFTETERSRVQALLQRFLGLAPQAEWEPPPLEAIELPPARLVPEELPCPASAAVEERVLHAVGRSTPELLRLRRGEVRYAPDVVAHPETPEAVAELLAWADARRVAVVPFGGGTSVTGGVEPRIPRERYAGVVSLDLSRLKAIREIDATARLVHVEAGTLAPELDAALRPHGLTIRHYPQSYYLSTVGGWIATRSAGHYSMLFGRIDDRVAALEVATPATGVDQGRPLPGSSVGPDPNRLWIGSEGSLGVITAAWLRVVPLPRHRAAATVRFADVVQGLEAVRAIAQSDLHPTHLRLLDPFENLVSRLLGGGEPVPEPVLILGFESADAPVDDRLTRAVALAETCGGRAAPAEERRMSGSRDADRWRQAFFRQPFLRDLLLGWGFVVDTFETAIPWSAAADFYEEVRTTVLEALVATCGAGAVLARTTHAYADGVAFYFTFLGAPAPSLEAAEERWRQVKTAATEVVVRLGGTASHHHAAGRDHVPWTDRELPRHWRVAFGGAKATLDPGGIMNPGVIFPVEQPPPPPGG